MKLTKWEKEAIERNLEGDSNGRSVTLEEVIGAEELRCLVDDVKIMKLSFDDVKHDIFHVQAELEIEFLRELAKEKVFGLDDDKYVDYEDEHDEYKPFTSAFWSMFFQDLDMFHLLGFNINQVKEKLGILEWTSFVIDIKKDNCNEYECNIYVAWIDGAEEDY